MNPAFGVIYVKLSGYWWSGTPYQIECVSELNFMLPYDIGDDDGCTSRNAGHTMHQYIGSLKVFIDKSIGLLEVSWNIEVIGVVGREVQIIWQVHFGMWKEGTFGCTYDCLDAQLWLSLHLLLRVFMFLAASKLPT